MKRFLIMVLSLVLALAIMPFRSFASETIPPEKTGSITLTLKYKGEPIKDGYFSCIQVADMVQEDANYYFRQLLEPDVIFRDTLPSVDDMYQMVYDNPTFFIGHKVSHTNTSGTVKFGGLKPGLYLIIQETASKGYTAAKPFLVSVPYDMDGKYIYDVDATVKAELKPTTETVPTEPTKPTSPSGDKIPQTGQLTWPVPVLALTGMVFFVLGWWMFFSSRKERYDA